MIGLSLLVGGTIGYVSAGYQYAAKLAKIQSAFPSPAIMTSVVGTIQGVSGNTITLKSSSMDPFENIPTVRTITVTNATKIVKNESKDMKVFAQEMDVYQKSVLKPVSASASTSPAAAGMITPPLPFTEATVSISDLKVGDMITVDAGKDVKTQASFEAVKISLMTTAPSAAAIPTGAAPTAAVPSARPAGMTAPIVNTPPPVKK